LKHFNSLTFTVAATSLCAIGLSGCSALSDGAFPSTPGTQTQTQVGTIQGNDFGGHAPITGAHVYLLQSAASGYGAQVTSLLSASYSTGSSYPTAANISDPNIPTTGTGTPWYYETSDSNGEYNITGDYTCTAGYPVYLYAYGGSPVLPSASNNYQMSQIVVSNLTGTGNAETATYTITVTPTESFYVGEIMTFSNLSGNFAGGDGYTASVVASNLTSTTFAVSYSDPNGSVGTGTYPTTGTVTASPSFNPGVANMAMLGICPSSGNFSTGGTLPNGSTFTPIRYVYMNEVSTVALAYAMAGFGTDGLHIGTDTATAATLTAPGIIGIQNAAANAANLYDIQGAYISTVFDGEGHIANPTTFSGSKNGTVPQAELDTLGNILAACVDSGNTYNPVTATGTESIACTTLFSSASSNGGNTGGTLAPNSGTAAFNIAHNPMTSGVVGLYTLPTGTVPFTPNLSAQPNDFTVGIVYSSTANTTSGATATTSIASPTALAIDSYGNAYVSATTSSSVSTITKISPLGTSLATSTAATGATVPGYMDFLALDQAGNVWATTTGTSVGSQSGNGYLFKFNSGLTTVSQVNNAMYAPTSLAIDNANNVFATQNNTQGGNVGYFAEFVGGGTAMTQVASGSGCAPRATSVTVNTIGGNEYLWTATNDSNSYCIAPVSGGTTVSSTNLSNTYNVSLDSNGYGWFGNHNQTNVYKLSSGGTLTAEGKGTGNNQNNFIAGLYDPAWSAIDGAGDVFIVNDNGTNSSVSELSNAGVALSCPACSTQGNSLYGYQPGQVSSVTAATMQGFYMGNVVVDPSGDVWVANYSGNSILEIVGVGYPVVTPLSSQKYGLKP
jgi:hypothetical protein